VAGGATHSPLGEWSGRRLFVPTVRLLEMLGFRIEEQP
jgi:hypothetical protein